jgi:hypothetical protein
MAVPGETEGGLCWWTHRDRSPERGGLAPRSSKNHIGSVDPDPLKIPARRAECLLTGNAGSPFHAEPEQLLRLGTSSGMPAALRSARP